MSPAHHGAQTRDLLLRLVHEQPGLTYADLGGALLLAPDTVRRIARDLGLVRWLGRVYPAECAPQPGQDPTEP